MNLGITVSDDLPFDRLRPLARDVEAAGLDSLWSNDALGRDPFLVCQAWADATSTLRVGVGVAQVLTRTPVQYAKAAATLQECSGGRFVLGFGISQAGAMEWHGLAIERPLTATREMLHLVSAITRGETTDHAGRVLSSQGFRLRISPLPPPVPLYVGAMRPKALALAGSEADGVLLSWEGPEAVERAVGVVRAAAAEAGRPAPEIAAYVRVALADDPAAARVALAREVASYWTYYAEHFAGQVLEASFARAQTAWERGGPVALADALDDEIVTTLGWYGTPKDDLGPLLARYEAAGVEHFIVRGLWPGDAVDGMRTLLRALA